jgi:hypothetical protein
MMKIKMMIGAVALAGLSGCVEYTNTTTTEPGRPAVGSENDLSSFEGAKAGQAEMGLMNLGYEPIRTKGLTAWWFNRDTGACARITTSNGRYSDVTMLPAEDC